MTTRRRFLEGMGSSVLAVGLTRCGGGGGSVTPSPPPPPPTPVVPPILVLVQIQGGNDGLSTLIPISGPNATAYHSLRPTLQVPAANTVDLGNGLGMTKDLLGFDALQSAGRLAWIPGIGMNNPNLSHFTSTDIWGMGSAAPGDTGWLGRWGDTVFAASDTLRGLSLTSDLLLMVHGRKRDFVGITSTSGYVHPSYLRTTAAVPDSALLKAGYVAGLTAGVTDALAGLAARQGQLWNDSQTTFNTLIKTRTPSVPYPGDAAFPVSGLSGSLSNQLKMVAQMIASDIPAQVYTVRMGGFDTHSNQATDHPKLMKTLGGAVSAFLQDLAAITTKDGPAADRVVLVGWSEFGRRAKENNGGTDHGAAGVAFVAGKPLKGGSYGGGQPSLSDLDAYGNLKFTTDFRSLYATLLDKWLLANSEAILGGKYPTLGFL